MASINPDKALPDRHVVSPPFRVERVLTSPVGGVERRAEGSLLSLLAIQKISLLRWQPSKGSFSEVLLK